MVLTSVEVFLVGLNAPMTQDLKPQNIVLNEDGTAKILVVIFPTIRSKDATRGSWPYY